MASNSAQRRSVSVNGVKLSILEAGQGDPVIYVHGVVTTSNIFPKYLEAYSPNFGGLQLIFVVMAIWKSLRAPISINFRRI